MPWHDHTLGIGCSYAGEQREKARAKRMPARPEHKLPPQGLRRLRRGSAGRNRPREPERRGFFALKRGLVPDARRRQAMNLASGERLVRSALGAALTCDPKNIRILLSFYIESNTPQKTPRIPRKRKKRKEIQVMITEIGRAHV